MQETFLKAIQNISDVRDPGHVRAWLVQIARRVCIDHYRRARPMQTLPEGIAAAERPPNPRLELLQGALAQIPEEYREAITVFYLDGRSTLGVAESLGISEGAARMRLTRGRRMLQELLKEREL
jgi:RNA polymerase sigma-70 factor (ECF subfamily)